MQEATLLSYAKSVATLANATTTTRRHSLLPPSGLLRPRIPANPRVGHGSHAVISDHTFRTPFRTKRRTDLATITQSSSKEKENRFKPCSIRLFPFVWLMATVGLETVCALDYERLLELHATQRIVHPASDTSCTTSNQGRRPTPTLGSPSVSDRARCSQQDPGHRRISDARLPVDDMGWPLDRGSAPPAAEPILFGLFTSLLTPIISTPPRHEPTSSFSEWNPTHSATAERRTTPSRDTETWLRTNARRRWRADCSVQHHKIETRALQRIVMLDTTTVACGQTTGKSLPALFAQQTWTPMPPDVGLGRPRANKNLRSSRQFRTFLELSVSAGGRTWWTRIGTAALHIPLQTIDTQLFLYFQDGWPPK